jgi:hypothetical protein
MSICRGCDDDDDDDDDGLAIVVRIETILYFIFPVLGMHSLPSRNKLKSCAHMG